MSPLAKRASKMWSESAPATVERPGAWPNLSRRSDMPQRTCSIEGCEKPHLSRGWCSMHWTRNQRNGDPHLVRYVRGASTEERFALHVDTAGEGCWEWSGGRDMSNYGRLKVGDKYLRAHRISWEMVNGPIPEGLCVLHRCDNPPCVRPDHLFLGTRADNTRDMIAKGRARYPGNGGRGGRAGHVSARKLSSEAHAEIRLRYTGVRGQQAQLAQEFGVHPSTISLIVHGHIGSC